MISCPNCGAEMILRQTQKFKTKDGKPSKFYGCSKWPECKATHGAHPNGEPLGVPADLETKQLRMEAHKLCEKIWGEWAMMSGHISKMDKHELKVLINLLQLRDNNIR